MSKNEQQSISFRINHIETLQFAILQETVNENALSLSAAFGFGVDSDARMVRCTYRYEFFSDHKRAMVIETAMDFILEEVSFKNQILKEDKCVLPKTFATHLAMILVGTTRGILFEKTKGTSLNAFPMPTVNVTESIANDVELTNQKS